MNSTALDYEFLPGFSGLYIDFLKDRDFFAERFPANRKLFATDNELEDHALAFDKRENLVELVKRSMLSVELHSAQENNLQTVKSKPFAAVITGQQAGFLGGPLYTIVKALSAISLCSELSSAYPAISFIPFFWVEDNDHDSMEVAQAYLYNSKYEPVRILCEPKGNQPSNMPISSHVYGDDITNIIDEIEQILPYSNYKSDIISMLRSVYQPGANWSDSFVKLLNNFLAQEGMLFIKASEARKLGLFDELALVELQSRGKSHELISLADQIIDGAGYHLQAKSSDINLFCHIDSKRHKIKKVGEEYSIGDKTYTLAALAELAGKSAGMFSPNVLLRPVFQDSLMPVAAYIGGPSEIGYCTQIRELYDMFGVRQPAILPRHSVTLLNEKIASIADAKFTKFFLDQAEFDRQMLSELSDNLLEEKFTKWESGIREIFSEIGSSLAEIDKNLQNASETAEHKTMQIIGDLHKKTNAALRKKNADQINKIRMAKSYLYPNGTYQERYYSSINIISEYGIEVIVDAIKKACLKKRNQHYILKIEK